ncbi:MAG: hypothetical protein AAGH78_04360 [Cyanobacteria bacterium P01_H01_bin.58]
MTRRDQRSRYDRYLALGIAVSVGTLLPAVGIVQAQSAEVVQDCNQFAAVVNRGAASMSAFESEIIAFSQNAAQAETLDDITRAAQQYVDAVDDVVVLLDTMVVDLDALPLVDTQVSTYRSDYARLVTGFSDNLSLASDAMGEIAAVESETQLQTQLESSLVDMLQAVEEIEGLAAQTGTLIEGVNAYCGTTL